MARHPHRHKPPPDDSWAARLRSAGLDTVDAHTVALLDAGKLLWRNGHRDSQRRILSAMIRYLGRGEHVTMKQYDTARPSWMPNSGLIYQTLGEKWTETVAAALGE